MRPVFTEEALFIDKWYPNGQSACFKAVKSEILEVMHEYREDFIFQVLQKHRDEYPFADVDDGDCENRDRYYWLRGFLKYVAK